MTEFSVLIMPTSLISKGVEQGMKQRKQEAALEVHSVGGQSSD